MSIFTTIGHALGFGSDTINVPRFPGRAHFVPDVDEHEDDLPDGELRDHESAEREQR